MTPQLTTAYFVGEIFIQDVIGAGDYVTARAAELANFWTIYEEEYLRMLLGDDLFDALEAADAAVVAPAVLGAPWSTLLAQIYFTKNSLPYSPAACYVYFKFTQHHLTVSKVNGEARSKNENAEMASAKLKLVAAWNRMVQFSDDITEWIIDNGDDYPLYAKPSPDYLVTINQFGI
jgi:hypothetical protein